MFKSPLILCSLLFFIHFTALPQKAARLIKKGKFDKAEAHCLSQIAENKNKDARSARPNNIPQESKRITPHHYLSKVYEIKGNIAAAQKEIVIADSIHDIFKQLYYYSKKPAIISVRQGVCDPNYHSNNAQMVKRRERLLSLIDLHMQIGEMDEAKDLIAAYQSLYSTEIYGGKNTYTSRIAYSILGQYYFLNNQYDSSLLFYEKYIIALRSSPRHIDDNVKKLGDAYTGLSKCYLKLGDLPNALLAAQHAEKYEKHQFTRKTNGKNYLSVIKSYNLIAEIYRQQHDYHKALSWNTRAYDLYNSQIIIDSPDKLELLETRGKLFWVANDTTQANACFDEISTIFIQYIKRNFTFLSESEREYFYRSNKHYIELVKSYYHYLYFEKGYKDSYILDNFYYAHINSKGVLLTASSKLVEKIFQSKDSALINQYIQLQALKESRSRAYKSGQTEILTAIDKSISQIERTLLSELNIEIEQTISSNQILASLKDSTQLIDILRISKYNISKNTDSIPVLKENVENKYVYFISSADRSKFNLVDNPLNQEQLEKKYYKGYLNEAKFNIKNNQSYTAYFSPFEQYISTNTVIFSADGIYNLINPVLLYDGSKYLIDKYYIYSISQASDLLTISNNDTYIHDFTLVGWPDFSTHFSFYGESPVDLPGTGIEIAAIEKIIPPSIFHYSYVQKNANEISVKALPSTSLLHFATHGYFEVSKLKDAMYTSGLILAISDSSKELNDGYLSAYEASNLHLENTFLVVMSACETGQGETESGEGVWGLQRSFQVAGVKYVVMSLFKVSDEVTAQLMLEFYKNIFKGQDIPNAFRNAQLSIKNRFDKADYWGAFIIKGY